MFWIILTVLGSILGAGQFAVGQAQVYPPFAAAIARRAYKEHPDLIPQVAELIAQRFKGVIPDDVYYSSMRQAGYNEVVSKQLLDGAQSLLTGYDYVNLWRRGLLDKDQISQRLGSLGYSDESKDDLINATLYYPRPDDLVRMAVREVFTPATAEKYGQFEDLPEEFLEASDKAGLSREFATNFWAAHWQLPSANQGYEMYQREIISKDDLLLLLKNLDYMPYWRTHLEQLQYNVITRVDIRRLYKTGVYTEEQVYKGYLHMGYSPDDAQDLTQFTIKEYAPVDEEKQKVSGLVYNNKGELVPSRAMVIDAYNSGVFTKEEAEAGLANIGYPTDAIKLILDSIDNALKQQIIDIEADAIADDYRNGVITLDQFRIRLTTLGVTSRYMEIVIAREIAQSKRRSKNPSKADLEAWTKKGIIPPEEYTRRMIALGYSEDDATLYLEELIYDVNKSAS